MSYLQYYRSLLDSSLGVTLRLFNLVEKEIIKLDGCKMEEEMRARLAEQLFEKEKEINEIQSKLHRNCEKIIELENIMLRFQAVANGRPPTSPLFLSIFYDYDFYDLFLNSITYFQSFKPDTRLADRIVHCFLHQYKTYETWIESKLLELLWALSNPLYCFFFINIKPITI